MGAIGRKRIEDTFAWEHQAARYLCVYAAFAQSLDPAMEGRHE